MARKDAIYELLKPQVTALGYELYEVDFEKAGKKRILTVYIDREGGVSLEDCEKVSREIGAFLDAADPIAETYTLQVSSPGLERKLTRLKHYRAVIGEMIDLKFFEAIDGKKQLCAVLRFVDDEKIVVQEGDAEPLTIPFKSIAKASLHFEF
ncbi:ribosome maturation factor RimP [Pseudoramibacter faecis]|uniref:ribosome maturation factor RimP n=1 Tax=Pseudoramibacter faecis TaxID=3108534 RepID=UPI002E79CE61|nr:ribosome maturation factor RimP [Pseudoramibacter sp. HA2172]